MELKLPSLQWIDDRDVPRAGGLNMAIDELLLRESRGAWLRCYAWEEPTISIGYFADPPPDSPSIPVVRRWTGGGLVHHGGGRDATFALGIPRSSPLALLRPVASYRWIHSCLLRFLAEHGVSCQLAGAKPGASSPGGACFQHPVAADLVAPEGRKIAGGAQRRSRHGMLHQGSIQGIELGDEYPVRFAAQLSERAEPSDLDTGLVARASELAARRYAPLSSP